MIRFLVLALLCVAPAIGESLTVTVTSIPSSADRVAVAVDFTGATSLITTEQTFAAGTSTTAVDMTVPPGSPLRIRVIAYNGSTNYGAVLSDGKAMIGPIGMGGSGTATVDLGAIVVTPDPANVTSATAGTQVTFKFNITDPGDTVEDAALVGLNFTGATVLMDNGGFLIGTGAVANTGTDTYVATATSTLGLNPISLAYDLVIRMRWGSNNPELYTPPVGAAPFLLNVTTPSTVVATVANIPLTATQLGVLVDGPGITGTLGGVRTFGARSASASLTVAVPPGGPYRVRAYVNANPGGGAVPDRFFPVLGDGETTADVIAPGAPFAAGITLGQYIITVDPSTPISAPAGTPVAFRFNINDPGEVVEGLDFGLNVSPTISPIFYQNGTNIGTAKPVKATTGIYTLNYQATLPSGNPTLFYAVSSASPYYFGPPEINSWQIAINLPCSFSLSPKSASLTQVQGGGSFTVTANEPGCPWNAQSLAPWLSIFPSTTSGSGTMGYVALANTDPAARAGTISVGGQIFTVTQLGRTGTPPAPAKAAIFRGNGTWVLDSNDDFAYEFGDQVRSFGATGDQPVAGDWTGNGQVRIGVFRNGTWMLDLNNNGQWDGVAGGDGLFSFGSPGDVAVVGDWTGDGISKLGIFRCPPAIAPGNCYFVLDVGAKFAYDPLTAQIVNYGATGDRPVISTWTGPGQPDRVGVFRNGLWIVDSNGSGAWEPGDTIFSFGAAQDFPMAGDWTGNGLKRIGVFRPSTGQWVLDINANNRFDGTSKIFNFGVNGDLPVAGNWTLP